ncbi:unnamed protein product [Symbiodinium pilosum]|uniref:C3H1-type domain-containing protein n=1 Tax=Symbiodinium pilosum TaxID=2952 RepID=A0A812X0A7_SYMPI|nr:unnamed protein product [Symbiodinium pilosum]
MAMVDSPELPERLGWFCCNRRARAIRVPSRGDEKTQMAEIPPQPEEADADEPGEGEAAEEEEEAEAMQPSPLNRAERPDAETGSSGYFSNSNSSRSDSDASDPCFWKPRRVQSSDGSVTSATSSEYWQAEAQKQAELERQTAQVPLTEAGKPTSVGSINHPNGCCPCMFFAKPSGCIRGVQCEFCHFPHQVNVKKHLSAQRSAASRNGTARGQLYSTG